MASLPASNAVIRRCVCSSNSSRLLSSHSPARPWASVAIVCARRAHSPLLSISRVSRPVLGATSSAAAAPMIPPRKNQPRYPAASFRSLAMTVVSFVASQATHEHVHAPSKPGGQADDLTRAGETAQRDDHAAQAGGRALHVLGHLADALDLAPRLAREVAQLVGE